jgi:hypothetical protein
MAVMHHLSRRIDGLKQFLPIAIFNMIKEHALPTCNTEVMLQPMQLYNIEVIPPASLTNEELVLFEDISSTTTLPIGNANDSTTSPITYTNVDVQPMLTNRRQIKQRFGC